MWGTRDRTVFSLKPKLDAICSGLGHQFAIRHTGSKSLASVADTE